jgi:NAD(P)H-dependent FMN reductase
VVLVTAQYNWGYPAALKNAIDHLYREWRGKPVLLVTYGGHGGDKCAAQLRQVLGGIGVRLTDATPGLHLARSRIEANDGEVEPDIDFEARREDLIAGLHELVALAETAPV